MSNPIVEAIQAAHPYEEPEVREDCVTVPTKVQTPVGISEAAIFKALLIHFDRPEATLGVSEAGSCKFRANGSGSDRTRCAFGVFIPDYLYDRVGAGTAEGWGVNDWIDSAPVELGYLAPHKKLLGACQSLHDGSNQTSEHGLTGAPLFVVKLIGLRDALSAMDNQRHNAILKPETPADDEAPESAF